MASKGRPDTPWKRQCTEVTVAGRPVLLHAQVLHVNGNELTELPESIGNLQALTELGVYENQLTELPKSIGNLQALTLLHAQHNQLDALPGSIGDLRALTQLFVGINHLTTLPESISKLQALSQLHVQRNQLAWLPESIGHLKALAQLYVDDNRLTALPESIGHLQALTVLNCKDNQLKALPESIDHLQALTTLNLRYNRLTALPESFGKLQALSHLDTGHNRLTALPKSICHLQALSHLYVNHNQLMTLPESIGKLQALSHLNVDQNELTALPESIGNLQAHANLHVGGNPLQLPPLSVALRSLRAIRAFFEDLNAGSTVTRTCMLVLVGDAEMGKTSLLNGLRNDCTPAPSCAGPEGRTIHIEISELPLLRSGELAVHYRCYDLAGQQASYAAAQQAYVAPGALYLLVVSAACTHTADDEARLLWWLQFLQVNAPGSVVQPILTHVDTCADDAEIDARVEWIERTSRHHLSKRPDAGGITPLTILCDQILRVNSTAGGGATLLKVQDRLLELACPPPGQRKLLPIVGRTIPKLWEPAIAAVNAVRNGRNCAAAAAREALRGDSGNSREVVDRAGAGTGGSLYVLVSVLHSRWAGLATELADWLRTRRAGGAEDDDERVELQIAAFSQSSQVRSILNSVLQLMADQGDIFVAGDMAYLDPAAIVSLISPLVDHRLRDVNSYLATGVLFEYVLLVAPAADSGATYERLRAALERLAGPQALLDPELLGFLWRHETHHEEHYSMLSTAGILLRLSANECVVTLRLQTARPHLDDVWPSSPRNNEWQYRREYHWDSEGFVPPGLCQKIVAAFQTVDGCRYLSDPRGHVCVWQRGVVLELSGADGMVTVLIEASPATSNGKRVLRLVADARGPDAGRLDALLATGSVNSALETALASFPGLCKLPACVVVSQMQERWIQRAVVVTVGNQYSGDYAVDCHLSAQHLHNTMRTLGLRTEPPWINQDGGPPMVDKLQQVLATHVHSDDDGFIFCFCGHGLASELQGQDGVLTSYQEIVDVISSESKLLGKPKLIVFDCCQSVEKDRPTDQLRLPSDTLVARSTGFGTRACEEPGFGGVYSNELASLISSSSATHTIEDLLKLTHSFVQDSHDGPGQVAHVESSLGPYHLYLGSRSVKGTAEHKNRQGASDTTCKAQAAQFEG